MSQRSFELMKQKTEPKYQFPLMIIFNHFERHFQPFGATELLKEKFAFHYRAAGIAKKNLKELFNTSLKIVFL